MVYLPKHKIQHQYLFIARVKNEEENVVRYCQESINMLRPLSIFSHCEFCIKNYSIKKTNSLLSV